MSKTEMELKDFLRENIYFSMEMASFFKKKNLLKRLSILLVQLEYLSFWEISTDLEEVNLSMMSF